MNINNMTNAQRRDYFYTKGARDGQNSKYNPPVADGNSDDFYYRGGYNDAQRGNRGVSNGKPVIEKGAFGW